MLFAVLRIFYNEQLLLFFFLRKKCLNVSMHSKVAVSMKADPLTPPQVNYFRDVLPLLFQVKYFLPSVISALVQDLSSSITTSFILMSLPLYSLLTFFPYNQPINILKALILKPKIPFILEFYSGYCLLPFLSKPRFYAQNSLQSLSLFLHLLLSLQFITIAQDTHEECFSTTNHQIQRTLLLEFMLLDLLQLQVLLENFSLCLSPHFRFLCRLLL